MTVSDGDFYGFVLACWMASTTGKVEEDIRGMVETVVKRSGKFPESEICKAMCAILTRYQRRTEEASQEAIADLQALILDGVPAVMGMKEEGEE